MNYYIMTSINIQTVSDRSNFINFFSEPITLPKNTQIALPKAHLKVPVYVIKKIFLPLGIGLLDEACRVEIDGISASITWGNIYAAHQDLPGIETFNGFDEWRDNYVYLPNNQIIFFDPANAEPEVKTDFNSILARAITQRYDFYIVSPAPRYKNLIDDEIGAIDNLNSITQPNGGNNFFYLDDTNNFLTDLGFNVEYAPIKMFNRNQSVININSSTLVNWIQGADTSSLRGSTGACCAYIDDMEFDYNGGYIQTIPNCTTANAGALMSFGFDFLGAATQANDEKHAFNTGYDTTMYDIGIEFGYDGANFVYNILTKANQYNSTTDTPILHSGHVPHRKVNGFDNNGDHFFIQITRSNDLHDSNAWVVNILQGVNTDPNTDPNAVVVYSETFNFNPQTNLVPLYQCNAAAGTDAWEFNNNGYIARSAQTIAQGDMTNSPHNLGEFLIEPALDYTTLEASGTVFQFWNLWGLFNKNVFGTADPGGRSNYYTSVEGNKFIRIWQNPTNFNAAITNFFIGSKTFDELYRYKPAITSDFLDINPNQAIGTLPQFLNVSVNNIDVKNFNGTLPYGSNTVADATSSDPKVVGTIPFPVEQIDMSSVNVEINYEPYNLLYRPINNPNIETINQFNIEIFYKDFRTNRKKNIDDIIGTANLEFHIRSGGTPAPPNKAGLRPY